MADFAAIEYDDTSLSHEDEAKLEAALDESKQAGSSKVVR